MGNRELEYIDEQRKRIAALLQIRRFVVTDGRHGFGLAR